MYTYISNLCKVTHNLCKIHKFCVISIHNSGIIVSQSCIVFVLFCFLNSEFTLYSVTTLEINIPNQFGLQQTNQLSQFFFNKNKLQSGIFLDKGIELRVIQSRQQCDLLFFPSSLSVCCGRTIKKRRRRKQLHFFWSNEPMSPGDLANLQLDLELRKCGI